MNSSEYVILLIVMIIFVWIILATIPRLKWRNEIFLIISFVLLLIFLCIRKPYSDMITYENFFNNIDINHIEKLFENRWEVLFKILLYGIRLVTNDSHIMLCIVSLITLIGPFLFIRRYSKNYLLSIVMFITIGTFHIEFYVLRQAIAISIFLACFYLVDNKKFFKYLLAIIVASLFHKTALVLLLVYPIVNIPRSKYKNVFLTVITILCLMFSSQISNLLMNDFYDRYADKVFSGGGIKLLLFYIILFIVYLILKRYSRDKEKESIVKISLFTIIMQFFAVQNNAFSRIAAYTRDSFCFIIPNSIQELNAKNRLLSSILIIVMCICYILVTNMFSDYSIIFVNT